MVVGCLVFMSGDKRHIMMLNVMLAGRGLVFLNGAASSRRCCDINDNVGVVNWLALVQCLLV